MRRPSSRVPLAESRSECPDRTSPRPAACRGSSMPSSSDTLRPAPSCDRRAAERDLRHRVAQHAARDRVALGVVGVEQALRRCPLHHLGQLPSEVHRILHTGVEALSPTGECTCAASPASRTRPAGTTPPAGSLGEPGDRRWDCGSRSRSRRRDERLAEIAQGGLAPFRSRVRSVTMTPYRPASL
jgi:hypothetical protein